MIELVGVFNDWYQVLIDGEQAGNLYQEDGYWTVEIYSYFPQNGYNTIEAAVEWAEQLVC